MRLLIPALLAFVFVACRGEPTSAVSTDRPALARASGGGGKGGGSGSTAIVVSGASPAIAPTDTVIDVLISGSGFAKGATARWAIGGDTTQVQVLSNGYVNSSTLKARIAVPAGATLGSYDIIVTNVGGKKGVGAEVFEVIFGNPDVDFLFANGRALGLMGDGLAQYNSTLEGASFSLYHEPVCGVTSNVFETSESSSGDMVMQTNPTSTRSNTCPDYPRRLVVRYGADNGFIIDARPAFINLREISRPGYVIPIGETRDRILSILFYDNGPGCSGLRFNPNNPAGNGASLVEVTRLDRRTYRARSKPGGKAYCVDNGALYDIPVDLVVVAERDLPI